MDVLALQKNGGEIKGSRAEMQKVLDRLNTSRSPVRGFRAFLVGLYQRVSKTL